MVEDQLNVHQMVFVRPTIAPEGVKAGLFVETTDEGAMAFLNERLPGLLG